MMTDRFDFFQNWYPVSPLEDLDPGKPTPVTLLGMNIVLWKPPASPQYRAFLDQCPHRLAPLSEGRIDETSGNLMCSYHGWEFDTQGTCTRIPQAENPELVDKNRQNFCVSAFPTREAQEMLWIWADRTSPELAERTPLPLSDAIDLDTDTDSVWKSMVRDLDYDWQTLIENVADPSHVPFAHHGLQGDRKMAFPLPIKVVESTPKRIAATIDRGLNTKIVFEPPCRLEYCFSAGDKRWGLLTYCLPISPGKSRLVAFFPRNFAKTFHRLTPRWWDHIALRNLVLEGDMILLHQQERYLQQKRQSDSWKNIYKMPTSADRLVIEFRRWFDLYSQGKLPWEDVGIFPPPVLPTNGDRRQVLDRYSQHTQHCSSCRNALKQIKRLQVVLLVYFTLAISTAAVMPDGVRSRLGLPLVAIALLGLGAWTGLKFWLEPRFYFVDYVHSEKN